MLANQIAEKQGPTNNTFGPCPIVMLLIGPLITIASLGRAGGMLQGL